MGAQVFTKASEFLELVKEAQPFFFVMDNYTPPNGYVSLYDEPYDGLAPLPLRTLAATSPSGSSSAFGLSTPERSP